jgi:glycerol-3-phosphate acyltransferase PlsY
VILKRRKFFRIGAGIVFPLVYYFSPNKIIVEILILYLLGIMTTLEVMRYVSPSLWRTLAEHSKGILKVREGMITGTTALLISNAIVIAFFNKWVAIVSLVYMLFGDAAAAIVGTKYGKVKMGGKTLEGSLSFFITAMVLALIFSQWMKIPIHPLILIFGAIAATITEALPIEINDNLTVAIASAIIMQIFL